MFRGKEKKTSKPSSSQPMGMDFLNFGNLDTSSHTGSGENDDLENDAELLAELAALQKEELQKQQLTAVRAEKPSGSKKPANAFVELNEAALKDALADAPTGEFNEDIDDSSLENDPDLLRELSLLTDHQEKRAAINAARPVNAGLIIDQAMFQRLAQLVDVYQKLHSQARVTGDGAKERRYQRSIEKLRELSVRVGRGEKISEDEIPPAPPGIPLNFDASHNSIEQRPVPPPIPPRGSLKNITDTPVAIETKRENFRSLLIRRRDAYTKNGKLAVAAKDKTSALSFVNTSKMFDQALAALDTMAEEELNINEVPPSPQPYVPLPRNIVSNVEKQEKPSTNEKRQRITDILQRRKEANIQYGKVAVAAGDKSAATEYMTAAKQFQQALVALEDVASIEEVDEAEIPPSPQPYRSPPKTFLDGLTRRREQFEELIIKYKAQGDSRKTRMNERMAAQYVEAIQEHKAGRPVDVDALPVLPNMTPLPPQSTGGSSAPPLRGQASVPSANPTLDNSPYQKPPARAVHLPEVGPLAPSGVAGESRNQAQLDFLLHRQNEFRQAAMHAKHRGNIDMAKKYLLQAKGFDPMIKAARAGLPVSIKDTPIPPQELTPASALQPKIVVAGSSSESGVEKRGEVLALLEKTLIEQVQKAENNRLRFTRLGDVGKVKLFEEWAKSAKSDLLLVREVAKQGLRVPQFHYEQRAVPNADLHPELAEDICELTIYNAVQVPLPPGYESQHAQLFVKYEFPYPSEKHQIGQTRIVAGTVSPDFNDIVQIQVGTRKSRGQKLLRVLKRAFLKLEVYQKGGFLRSDKLLGTAEVRLDSLETTSEIEESLPLKAATIIQENDFCCPSIFGGGRNKTKRRHRDNKKAVGGMLRIRIRIREPLGDTKLAVRQERWLLLDN